VLRLLLLLLLPLLPLPQQSRRTQCSARTAICRQGTYQYACAGLGPFWQLHVRQFNMRQLQIRQSTVLTAVSATRCEAHHTMTPTAKVLPCANSLAYTQVNACLCTRFTYAEVCTQTTNYVPVHAQCNLLHRLHRYMSFTDVLVNVLGVHATGIIIVDGATALTGSSLYRHTSACTAAACKLSFLLNR
jgi:hypothetical protein